MNSKNPVIPNSVFFIGPTLSFRTIHSSPTKQEPRIIEDLSIIWPPCINSSSPPIIANRA